MTQAPEKSAEETHVPAGAFVLLLVGAAAIAFAPIFVRLSELGPGSTALWRAALQGLGALVVLVGVALARQGSLKKGSLKMKKALS